MSNINLQTHVSKIEMKELDISIFLIEQLSEGLAIIKYSESGQPSRINIPKDFNFTVENNKLEIYNQNKGKVAFSLDNLSNYDFINWDEHIKFYSLLDSAVIKIAPIDNICKEEDALCIQ